MSLDPKFELPPNLQWKPGLVYDPVPEWWLQTVDDSVRRQLLLTRVEVAQASLQVQIDGLAKVAEILRPQQ